MEEIKPDLPQSKYHPLSLSEFQELKEFITTLGAYLPDNKTGYVWSTFTKLNGTSEPQPCNCPSSAGHWRRAVDYLFDYVKNKD